MFFYMVIIQNTDLMCYLMVIISKTVLMPIIVTVLTISKVIWRPLKHFNGKLMAIILPSIRNTYEI